MRAMMEPTAAARCGPFRPIWVSSRMNCTCCMAHRPRCSTPTERGRKQLQRTADIDVVELALAVAGVVLRGPILAAAVLGRRPTARRSGELPVRQRGADRKLAAPLAG